MIKIFIDANIYIDFYTRKSVKTLVPVISQLATHIISTQQVVHEVLRNRVDKTRNLLKEDLKTFTYNKPSLPDFLTKEAIDELSPNIYSDLEKWEKDAERIKKLVIDVYRRTIEHVSKGDDEISRALDPIFQSQLVPKTQDIEKARLRKELGNPPGKKQDPIGDELSWEQLLRYRSENSCEIWIVSRDEDFYTLGMNNEVIPNSYLLNEVRDEGPNVKFFRDLPTALKQYKSIELPDLELPSEDEMQKVIEEEEIPKQEACTHEPMIIHNGRFDIYVCKKCNKTLGAYLADMD
jgi:hypothetical protein